MPTASVCLGKSSQRTCIWLIWLLALQPALAVTTRQQDQQQQQHAGLTSLAQTQQIRQQSRSLLADTKLYCNVTSECKPCLAKHLDSEACRPTAYTEHLTCSTSEAVEHETTLTIHRRLSPRTTLLHVSRSCRAPAEQQQKASAASAQYMANVKSSSSSRDSADSESDGGGSSDKDSTKEVPLDEQAMQHGSSNSGDSGDSGNVGNINLSGAAKAVHLYPLSTVGGLNLLYFELAMLVILSGALPVVYTRKRRYVRL